MDHCCHGRHGRHTVRCVPSALRRLRAAGCAATRCEPLTRCALRGDGGLRVHGGPLLRGGHAPAFNAALFLDRHGGHLNRVRCCVWRAAWLCAVRCITCPLRTLAVLVQITSATLTFMLSANRYPPKCHFSVLSASSFFCIFALAPLILLSLC